MQEEQNTKFMEQQVALLRVQADMGSEAARPHRDEVNASRARDGAIASLMNFREGEDVQDYFVTAERELTA